MTLIVYPAVDEVSILAERLGRLLYQVESIEHSDSETLVDAEEKHGAHALLLWLPTQHLRWAVERRVWEVGAAIHFIKKGHFVFVEGEPTLLCPTVGLDPDEVAMEGGRRLEAFRQGTKAEGDEPYAAPRMAPPPPALPRRLAPIEIDEHALALVLDRIREAENHASD